MMNNKATHKMDIGKLHVRFDEGNLTSVKSRRLSLSYILMMIAMMLCCNTQAGVSITNIKVTPLSPWGGVVSYLVEGSLPDNASSYSTFVILSNTTTKTCVEASVVMGDVTLKLGEHKLWWNGPAARLGEYTVSVKCDPLCSRGEIAHNWVLYSSSSATCESPGYWWYKCSGCEQIKREISRAALGHNWVFAWHGGYEGAPDAYRCSRCYSVKYGM